MNKKLFFPFLIIIMINLCPLFLEAKTTLELRVAAFIPTDQLFRKIYGDAGPSFQIELSSPLYWNTNGWVNFDYFTKSGHVHGCGKSSIHIYNFSLGPKQYFKLNNFTLVYIGIGLNIAGVSIHNKNCCGGHDSKTSCGGILKTGINYYFYKDLFIDLFCDYLYQRIKFKRNANISGFKIGLGVGTAF